MFSVGAAMRTLLPAEAALKVLTWYPNEGPSMTWVERHRTAWASWVEAIGPPTPIGRKFGGAVEETLFEDCAPSAAHDPPLVLRAAVGAITLRENCCYLGNQETQFDTASLFPVLQPHENNTGCLHKHTWI